LIVPVAIALILILLYLTLSSAKLAFLVVANVHSPLVGGIAGIEKLKRRAIEDFRGAANTVGGIQAIGRSVEEQSLRLRQTRQRPDPLAGLQIDHLDSIVAQGGREKTLTLDRPSRPLRGTSPVTLDTYGFVIRRSPDGSEGLLQTKPPGGACACSLGINSAIIQRWNLGFYPPAFFFYQFLLFAVFDAVRLVPERWPSRTPAINSPSQCVGESLQTVHPTIWTANWSSWNVMV
jgi:hypothetical protein